MKTIFTLLFCVIAYSNTFAQIEKTILKHSQTQPRWVINCDDETTENCVLTIYFRDGRQKGRAEVIYHNKREIFRPNGDAIVYYENGQVHQEYNHASGILLTFYRSGELKEKMITPIDGDMEFKYKYYKTGQLWEEEESKHEVGKQNLSFGHSRQRDYFYDNRGYSYNFLKTYHSNGELMSHYYMEMDGKIAKYFRKYYTPEGVLDTNAIYNKISGRFMKQGRRYTYYPNGQLQLITHYENDKIFSERLMWSSKGVLIEKGNYKSGSRHGKFESWWENGQPKEISYHRGYYKHGPILRWHRDGRILEQGSYYDGKALGFATSWDSLGNLRGENAGSIEVQQHNWYYNERNITENTYWYRGEGKFHNGMREGKWKFYYDKKGKKGDVISGLCAVINYKNGIVDGKVIVYHPNGGVLMKARLKDGWLDGDYITMHETGDIINKGQYKNHKKTGLWTNYHHKSSQIYGIRSYENDSQKDIYKEWDKDGFLKHDRIDKKRKKEVEFYTYYKSGMKIISVIPYGWKYGHYYEYDNDGNLKKTRIRESDDPKKYIGTTYYPNGQKASVATVVNNKTDGIYWAWYEDGSQKYQISHENGKRNGTSYSWDEKGVKTTSLFKDGIQIIQSTVEEEALECACNHPPKEVKTGFMNWFLSYVEYEKIKGRTKYFDISEKSYKKLFSKSIRMYDNRVSGTLAVVGDVFVEIQNGLRLDLTACRRGSNRTHFDISGDYSERRDEATVRISNFDLSVQFPQNILQLYDLKKKQPLDSEIEKYERSSVTFESTELDYSDSKGVPTVEIKTKGSACFQISEIGNSGILFNGNNPKLDLLPKSFPRDILRNFKGSDFKKYQASAYNSLHFVPSRNDLNSFMGIYFPNGQLYITYQDQEIIANANHIFIDGKEIHGNIEISNKVYPTVFNPDGFLFFLKSKDFEILKTEVVNDEMLHVFWKYVGQ